MSTTGTIAIQTAKHSADVYLIPLSPLTGQPTGTARRLTRDGRYKMRLPSGGDPGTAYFYVEDPGSRTERYNGYGLDLESGRQTLMFPGYAASTFPTVSPDGRQIAYSIMESDGYSIRIGEPCATLAAARVLCKGCGLAMRFSADGRFLFYLPEASSSRKRTVRLLEVGSGKDRLWLEHPSDSVVGIGTFGVDLAWVAVALRPPGATGLGTTFYIVPWSEQPVPSSKWIEVKFPGGNWNYSPTGNFFSYYQGSKLMAMRFDPKSRSVSEPYEVKFVSGSTVTLKPDDPWWIRGPGLVFMRRETTSSVWLMKLPR